MTERRDVLKQGGLFALLAGCGGVGLGLGAASAASVSPASAFDAKTLEDALRLLGATPVDSDAIVLTTPDIAENGAVVPIAVASAVPNTEAIHILVEKNPFPLAASFTLPEGTEPYVSTRVKMSESTRVHAVVRAGGRLYTTSRDTKVTLGGCGG